MMYRYIMITLLSSSLLQDVLTSRVIHFNTIMTTTNEHNVINYSEEEMCPQSDSVSYDGMDLEVLPPASIRSDNIKSVSLRDNQLSKIPIEIFETARHVECMDLSQNHISLNAPLIRWENDLAHLLLNNQKYPCTHPVHTLAEYFPSLKILHMNGFYRERCSLNFSQSFSNLHQLYLGDNDLLNFNKILGTIPPTLKVLHLEGNKFHNIRSYNLENLEALYLDNNPIDYISIDYESSLNILSMSGCQLGQASYIKLNLPYLKVLDLSANNLKYIERDRLVQVPTLLQLSLKQNELTEIPDLHMLPELAGLDLGENSIETVNRIPIASLVTLSLRKNKIKKIEPNAFSELSQLQNLDLSENQLSFLPIGWSNELMALKILNLRGNNFAHLWTMAIADHLNLTDLYVEANLMNSVDEDLLKLLPEDCNVYVAYRRC